MEYLFRAKDENGNLVYGSVVYGRTATEYWGDSQDKTHFFITDIEYYESLSLIFDEDGYPEEDCYDEWQVCVVEIDWNTLEFNLNGEWIKYEVKE